MTNKTTLKALERVFAAEVDDRLPFQSKAAIYKKLCEDGLVQPMDRTFGRDRLGTIVVRGYQLTHAGRYLYCISCDEID